MELYQTHWWRCNGPCQTRRPHFGIVRRPANRAPGPSDYWFEDHRRKCGGTFIKIAEPEKKGKKNQVTKSKPNQNEITKYINNNTKTINNNVPKSVLKDSNNIPIKTGLKTNSSNTIVITKKGSLFHPKVNKPIAVFSGKGQTVDTGRPISNSMDVTEIVRNIWANKQLVTGTNKRPEPAKTAMPVRKTIGANNVSNPKKHKGDFHGNSPPTKVKKIDDYFKTTASNVLKDVYGEDFKITQLNDSKLFGVTTNTQVKLVDCPICNTKVSDKVINRHLDECLNKEVIETLCKDNEGKNQPVITSQNVDRKTLKDSIGVLPPIQPFIEYPKDCGDHIKEEIDIKPIQRIPTFANHSIDLTNLDKFNTKVKTEKVDPSKTQLTFDSNDINKVKSIVKKINYDKHIRKSDNFIVPKDETVKEVDFGFLPSFLDDVACEIKAPAIKIEPGTSKDIVSQLIGQECACCGEKVDKPIEQHLDECLAFFDNNTTIPEEASTSFANQTIVIDDDNDIFDETQTLNATGTKCPCPCCLQMIEQVDMNDHLDRCLN